MTFTGLGPTHRYEPLPTFRVDPKDFEVYQMSLDGGTTWTDSFIAVSPDRLTKSVALEEGLFVPVEHTNTNAWVEEPNSHLTFHAEHDRTYLLNGEIDLEMDGSMPTGNYFQINFYVAGGDILRWANGGFLQREAHLQMSVVYKHTRLTGDVELAFRFGVHKTTWNAFRSKSQSIEVIGLE